MDYQPKMLFGTLKFADRCGAKTRGGGRCQNMPCQIGKRCRMHGGHALRGPDSPRWKHGRYSKYKPVELADSMDIDALVAHWAAQPPVDFSWLDDLPNPLADLIFDVDVFDVLT